MLRHVLIVLLLALPLPAQGNVLRGAAADGVGITIEPLDGDSRQAGLSEAALRKVIEMRLKRAGLRLNDRAGAELYVRIVTLTSRKVSGEVLGYGAHLELSFREQAFVKRHPDTYFLAPTWFKGNVTVANPQQFKTEIVRALAGLTDQFLADLKRAGR